MQDERVVRVVGIGLLVAGVEGVLALLADWGTCLNSWELSNVCLCVKMVSGTVLVVLSVGPVNRSLARISGSGCSHM